jgi:hypothetical protein
MPRGAGFLFGNRDADENTLMIVGDVPRLCVCRDRHENARNGLGLPLEALAPLRVGGKIRRQDLDGDLAAEARVLARWTSPIPPAPSGAWIS